MPPNQEIDMAREVVITAAREGNEQALEAALNILEDRIREDAIEKAAKWLRHDYQPKPTR